MANGLKYAKYKGSDKCKLCEEKDTVLVMSQPYFYEIQWSYMDSGAYQNTIYHPYADMKKSSDALLV